MRSRWILALAITFLLSFGGGDLTLAKERRSGKKASRAGARKASVKKDRRARSGRSGKISRRARRGRNRDRYARRRRNSEPSQSQDASIATAPRPPASGIPAERIFEIQNALIKMSFLEGPASGQYDDTTVEAMKQFQSANGLSATGLPSASTLKKLGVSKNSNDGYAVPVKSVSEGGKKPD